MNDQNNRTKEKILKEIEALNQIEPWFHCIDLGNGIQTRDSVPHLKNLWHAIDSTLPLDLKGYSVLDIGCNAGFFSTSMKRKNADFVVGIDTSPEYIKQAEYVRDLLRLDIDYSLLTIYDLPALERSFNIVLCLGVIYHVIDPFNAARSVWNVTKDVAIIESAVTVDKSERPVWEFVFPGYDNTDQERCYNWWFPNEAGMKQLFLKAGFGSVETIYNQDDRAAIICRK